jgi:hypothetical protein
MTAKEATDKNIITKQVVINTPTSARLLPITADEKVIDKAKHWEEKENKTDFEKGIARGYKTMLHQLLVGIDFDKEAGK